MVSVAAEVVRVLVVDDHADDAAAAAGALGEVGLLAAVTRVDRVAAVDAALAVRFDLVITDYALPDGDGLAVLQRVRAVDDDVPVVMLSGTIGEERVVDAMRAGIDDFVLKSQLGRLGAAARQQLRYADARRRRRASDDAQRQSESDLRAVLDLLPIGVLVRHGERVAYVNGALAGYLGRDPAELLDRSVLGLFRAESHDRLLAGMSVTDSGSGDWPRLDLRYDRADGRIGTIEAQPVRRLQFGGRPAVLVTARDVTDERQLRERLQMADRMAAVGTLAAGVAHEINNPLACVTANLEVLREELAALPEPPPEPGRLPLSEMLAALDDAREGAERVRVIVRDLKLFSRGDGGERGPVDLAGVLQAAERMTANVVKGRARVVQEHAPLPPVDGNATRLCQVFVNLLVNAAQAIEPGHPQDNEVRVRAAVEGARVVVDVADTGAGVPPDVRRRVFEPFFTTKGVGGGTGLGLSVCHGIVSSLGGEIAISDGDGGRGTVVRVALPVWGTAPPR